MTINELKLGSKDIEKKLNSKIFSRDKDMENLENERVSLEDLKIKKVIYDKASILLKAQAAETREATIGTIESMISLAMKSIYGFDPFAIFEKCQKTNIPVCENNLNETFSFH